MNQNNQNQKPPHKMKNSSRRRLEAFRLRKSKESQQRFYAEAFNDTSLSLSPSLAADLPNMPSHIRDLMLSMLNIQSLETVTQSSPLLFADIAAHEEYDSGYNFDNEFDIHDLTIDDSENLSWSEEVESHEQNQTENIAPPTCVVAAGVDKDPVDVLSGQIMRTTDFTLPQPHQDINYYEHNGNVCEQRFFQNFMNPTLSEVDGCPRGRAYCKLCENLLFGKLLSRKKFRDVFSSKFGHTIASGDCKLVFRKRWTFMKYRNICHHYAKLGDEIKVLYDKMRSTAPRFKRNVYLKIGRMLDQRRELFQRCEECHDNQNAPAKPRVRKQRTRKDKGVAHRRSGVNDL